VIEAAGYLIALLKKHGIKMQIIGHYMADEIDKIDAFANERITTIK